MTQAAPTEIIFNRKYFCLHLPTSRIWIGQASSVEDACNKAGWYVDNCFCHYICEEVIYPSREAQP